MGERFDARLHLPREQESDGGNDENGQDIRRKDGDE
jgi:hypothetical protein